jgi:hypothetical protein
VAPGEYGEAWKGTTASGGMKKMRGIYFRGGIAYIRYQDACGELVREITGQPSTKFAVDLLAKRRLQADLPLERSSDADVVGMLRSPKKERPALDDKSGAGLAGVGFAPERKML